MYNERAVDVEEAAPLQEVKVFSPSASAVCRERTESLLSTASNYDTTDGFVLHISKTGKTSNQPATPPPPLQDATDLKTWIWPDTLPCDDTDGQSTISEGRYKIAHKVVPRLRFVLITVYCFIYVGAVCLFSKCSGETSQSASINVSSSSQECTPWTKFVRSLKFPLLSILGVVVISFITRLFMFFVALYTWSCNTGRAYSVTLKPLVQKFLHIAIIVVLAFLIFVLTSQVFKEEVSFEWVEVFAPAGLATIITVALDIEGETDFELAFKRKEQKDGYVYGLASQYFNSTLDPLLKPQGKREKLLRKWEDFNPTECLLVLMVEANLLVEEVFTNEEFADEIAFIAESDGMYLMKIKVAENTGEAAYINVPTLINDHLLVIEEWFRFRGRAPAPVEEQKVEYDETLRTLLAERKLPTNSAVGRIFFITVPNVDVKNIPSIIRQAMYRELGNPNTDGFLKNTKLANSVSIRESKVPDNQSEFNRTESKETSSDSQGYSSARSSLSDS